MKHDWQPSHAHVLKFDHLADAVICETAECDLVVSGEALATMGFVHRARKFWASVLRLPGDACWVWSGAKTPKGYGQVCWGGRRTYAHRVAWELSVGEPPKPGHEICHHCDNPSCVRPDHLFMGTRSDNMHDCHRKGRSRGTFAKGHLRTRPTTMTMERVGEMLAGLATGRQPTEMANEWDVSKNTVFNVIYGKSGHRLVNAWCCV